MHVLRESWLTAALVELKPVLLKANLKVPKKVKVSCGWPGSANRKKVVGECWVEQQQIFVSPMISGECNPQGVLATLLHEAVHACLPSGIGHKKPFKTAAAIVGLEGKATATRASDELCNGVFKQIVKKLGPYPHRALKLSSGKKKQTTRLIKMYCECGLTVRITKKWIDELESANKPVECWLCGNNMEYDIERDEDE